MMDSTDMTTPVTRGELHEVLSQVKQEHWRELREVIEPLATKIELHQELQTATAPLATKVELHQEIQAAIAPLATKAELHQEIQAATAPLATKVELHQEIQTAIAPLATKVELQTAIAPLATKVELQAAIAPLATKAELELWGGVLVARMQHNEHRIDRLGEQLQQVEQRCLTELARHTSAILEAMRKEIKACIEPLADLPGRMARVEAAVFGPTSRVRRTRRRKN